ncbi:DUF5007 domain-containing protein [Niabella pedocola]|uniref:DUF5007 domain-containing protein n=1 Tax=Niabella pedocola TaxID=1752077 RepID=A0ABS8PWF9_9BACT|nr:DUF5007 domain-containing protein [Niabella pedocola]MCD2424658.1 DUF5007 domain-containing protein [Niabella pedocola]
MITKSLRLIAIYLCGGILAASCGKKYFLPRERNNIGDDAQFNQAVFQPVLGRTTQYMGIFVPGSTTFPAQFRIINARNVATGQSAPELTNLYPVMVWKNAYTGKETSLAEIEAKREEQYRPVLEVGGSGQLTMWSMAKSSFIRSLPDSGYVFDIELSNSGGRRYFTNFLLQPFKERPFEPTNLDPITGQPVTYGTHPSLVTNITGDSTNANLLASDIDVFIQKVASGTTNNKLTFRFFDKQYNPINPDRFGATDWPNLVHGFNMTKTATGVSYDVSYPLPSVKLPTKYTNGVGDRAHLVFAYNTFDSFGAIVRASMAFDFSIYENANWEIIFVFSKDNPKFN